MEYPLQKSWQQSTRCTHQLAASERSNCLPQNCRWWHVHRIWWGCKKRYRFPGITNHFILTEIHNETFGRLGLIAAPALVQCPTLKFNLNADIFVASQVMEMPNLEVDSHWHWSAEAASFTVSVYSAGRRLSLDSSMLMQRCRLKEHFPSNCACLAWKQSGCSACFWSTFWWDRFGRSALVLSFF